MPQDSIRKLTYIAMISSIVVMGFPVRVLGDLYISHFFLVFIFLYTFIFIFIENKIPVFSGFILCLVLLFLILDLFNLSRFSDFPENYSGESVKFLLLLIGLYSFGVLFRNIDSTLFCFLCGTAIILNGLFFFFMGENIYSYGGRFMIPDFGSPNTYGMLLSFSGLVFLYYILEKKSIIGVFFLLVSVFLLILTESRGGGFSFLIGAGFILSRKISIKRIITIFLLTGGLLAAFYFSGLWERFFGVGEGYSSGRIDIWKHLYGDLVGNTIAFFFGFGSGSVNFFMFEKELNSAHSGFLTLHYYYGLFYLLIFFIVFLGRLVYIYKIDKDGGVLKIAIILSFLLSFFSDSLFLSSQGIIYFSFFLAYAFSSSAKNSAFN